MDSYSKKYLFDLEDRLFYVEQYNKKHGDFFKININDYIMRYLDGMGLSGYIPKEIYYGALQDIYKEGKLDYPFVIELFGELEL